MDRLTKQNESACELCTEEISCKACKLSEIYKRLAHYEALAAQGRLVELSCRVGDTVYQTDEARIRIYESTIKRIIYDTDGIAFDERAIGKNVFLTHEEAEAKLAEKGGAK